MRLAIVTLLFVGLVGMVLGTFEGCSSFFAWNGRHPIAVRSLGPAPSAAGWAAGHPVVESLVPDPQRRYTVSVQVVFERSRAEDEGEAAVEAKMPLVVRVKDKTGRSMAEVVGWLDPNEKPNVLYGQGRRRPAAREAAPELLVERLVGPVHAASNEPITVEVDLGPDRIQQTPILERRLVIYDDRIPPSVRNAFIVAGAGAIAFFAGSAMAAARWWRSRGAPRRRRRSISPHIVV